MKIWSTEEDETEDSDILLEIKKIRDDKDKEILALRTQVLTRERQHIEFLERLVLELVKNSMETAKKEPAPKLSPAIQAYLEKKSNNATGTKRLP